MTPEVRKALYGALAAVGTILVATKTLTDGQVNSWLLVADATLVVAALVMAAIKAKRVDYTVFYGAAAALLAAIAGLNLVAPNLLGVASQVLQLALVAVPVIVAWLRTDTSTASGQPVAEVVSV